MINTKITALEGSISYDTYIEIVKDLVEKGKTTGTDQSESLVNYTKLNYKRMTRLNKTIKLSEQIIEAVKTLPFNMMWVVITEAWCGDAAQNIPFIAQLAKASANVDLRIVLRDENLEFMDQYLTNGSRSIPKVIFMKADNLEELAIWGPRPEEIQKKMMEYKNNTPVDLPYEKFAESIHAWYAKDKNGALESELLVTFHSIKESLLA